MSTDGPDFWSDVQAVFASVSGHRLAGSVRAGAAVADKILARVPVP